MSINKLIPIALLLFFVFLLSVPTYVFAGHSSLEETDSAHFNLTSYFDLRDRETFIQITNISSSDVTIHIQIFNVPNLCNENNFFDTYTGNDTHVYNMRDILTNNGSPSGAVLPDDAYGIVFISNIDPADGLIVDDFDLIGNMRIIDDAGYEYRTNSAWFENDREVDPDTLNFNFSTKNGVTLSDVVFIVAEFKGSDGEWLAGPLAAHYAVDVDIFDVNENPLSCRDVIFSCFDEDNPLLEELLTKPGSNSSASVAAFEYGINEAIPHSRGGELLCPGNVITEGWVFLEEEASSDTNDSHGFFIGLNNGNGRGSMDSMWRPNFRPRPNF